MLLLLQKIPSSIPCQWANDECESESPLTYLLQIHRLRTGLSDSAHRLGKSKYAVADNSYGSRLLTVSINVTSTFLNRVTLGTI